MDMSVCPFGAYMRVCERIVIVKSQLNETKNRMFWWLNN